MILDDQQICRLCGQDFPLTAEGSELFATHQIAELAIDRAYATVRPSERAMAQLNLFEQQEVGPALSGAAVSDA